MPTLVVFANENDAALRVTDPVYANIGTTAVAEVSDPSGDNATLGQVHFGANYTSYISFLEFDTAVIGRAVVESASLSLFNNSDTPTWSGTLEVRAASWAGNAGDAIPLEAWRTAAQIATDTLAASLGSTAFLTVQYNVFTNVALPEAIARTESTRLSVSSSEYRLQTPTPAANESRWALIASANVGGTTTDPQLTVVYGLVTLLPLAPTQRRGPRR